MVLVFSTDHELLDNCCCTESLGPCHLKQRISGMSPPSEEHGTSYRVGEERPREL